MYRKKYLIDYEQTGGALGHLTIITNDGKQISGPFEETFLRQLNTLNVYNQINFNSEGKTYRITKQNDYYQIRSNDDTTLNPTTNYNYELIEYKFISIQHNNISYKQMKINKKDYDMLCKASDVGTQYILDTIIILDSTFNHTEPIRIRARFNGKTRGDNNNFVISPDNNTSSEYESQYDRLFPSSGSNYTFQTYN